jgi:adenine-specific DNA glycosylase
MDLGRVVCQANIAQCAQCFFQTSCASATLPALIVQKERTKRSVLRLIRLFCINDQGAVLGYQKSAGQWLEGYFEVPTFLVSPEIEQYPALEDGVSFITDKPATTIISQITKYRVINEVYQITPSEMQEFFGERESFYDFYDPNITNWGTVCKRIIRKYSTQHEAECAGA